MVEPHQQTRPGEPDRPNEHVRETTRETTVVSSDRGSAGWIAAAVVIALLVIGGLFYWSGDGDVAPSTSEVNVEVVPAPETAAPAAPAETAPAAPAETAPAAPVETAPATEAPADPALAPQNN